MLRDNEKEIAHAMSKDVGRDTPPSEGEGFEGVEDERAMGSDGEMGIIKI